MDQNTPATRPFALSLMVREADVAHSPANAPSGPDGPPPQDVDAL